MIRMLGMRRTMFVVAVDDAPILDAACTKALAPVQRRRLIALIEGQGVASDGAAWLRRVERKTLAALDARGEATAAQLTVAVPELAGEMGLRGGEGGGGGGGLATRGVVVVAPHGRPCGPRPRGARGSGHDPL